MKTGYGTCVSKVIMGYYLFLYSFFQGFGILFAPVLDFTCAVCVINSAVQSGNVIQNLEDYVSGVRFRAPCLFHYSGGSFQYGNYNNNTCCMFYDSTSGFGECPRSVCDVPANFDWRNTKNNIDNAGNWAVPSFGNNCSFHFYWNDGNGNRYLIHNTNVAYQNPSCPLTLADFDGLVSQPDGIYSKKYIMQAVVGSFLLIICLCSTAVWGGADWWDDCCDDCCSNKCFPVFFDTLGFIFNIVTFSVCASIIHSYAQIWSEAWGADLSGCPVADATSRLPLSYRHHSNFTIAQVRDTLPNALYTQPLYSLLLAVFSAVYKIYCWIYLWTVGDDNDIDVDAVIAAVDDGFEVQIQTTPETGGLEDGKRYCPDRLHELILVTHYSPHLCDKCGCSFFSAKTWYCSCCDYDFCTRCSGDYFKTRCYYFTLSLRSCMKYGLICIVAPIAWAREKPLCAICVVVTLVVVAMGLTLGIFLLQLLFSK